MGCEELIMLNVTGREKLHFSTEGAKPPDTVPSSLAYSHSLKAIKAVLTPQVF